MTDPAAAGVGEPDIPAPDAAPDAAPAPGERTHPATPLVRLWVGVVALVWFLATGFLNGDLDQLGRLDGLGGRLANGWLLLLLAGGLLAGLAAGWWSWFTTIFHVTATELRIENTGAFTESRRIAYSRIQAVDITQPFAARLLGLAELRIDVGGGDATKLAFLGRRRATELRDHLLARAHGVRDVGVTAPDAATSAWDDLSARDRVLVRLDPGTIVVGALLSTELTWILLAYGGPLVLAAVLGQSLLLVGGVVVPLVLTVGGFVSRRVIGQFRYTLAHTAGGLRVTRGLTTLASETIPTDRVQAIQVAQPLLWRLIGRYRVDVTVLRGIDVDASGEVRSSTLLLPVGTREQVRTVLDAVWPGLRLDAVRLVPNPRRARWLDPLGFAWNAFGADALVLVARQGWFLRREFIVPHARLQSVALLQGPLLRRLDLAHVELHTSNALGGGRVVHADAATARALVLDEMARARVARADGLLVARPLPNGAATDTLTP